MPHRSIRVNPHVSSALWAGVLTVIVAVGPIVVMDTRASQLGDFLLNAFATPGFYLAAFLGMKGGPDGLPGLPYVYALTFLIWWAAIDLAQTVWRWIHASWN